MDIDRLKKEVEEYRETCAGKEGMVVVFGKTGPAGMQVIDALVSAVEHLSARVAKLEGGGLKFK